MPERSGKLAEYNAKRDFRRTREPRGRVARARKSGLRFLVQKHAARRLHYDLRLEWEGVLLSWAVTRGPSDDPSQKRLAVRTEDHPLDYGEFEGTIPEGEYGGGTVMLWDQGTWEPLHDPGEGLEGGMLHFRVEGERMHGGWALVRLPPRDGEKRENWLLVKERDESASDQPERLTEMHVESVATGRSMEKIAADADGAVWQRDGGKPAKKGAKVPARKKKAEDPVVAGVRISSPDREMFPGAGVTKLDVARYYAEAGARILEQAGRRPFSLVRCPDGIGEQCFYQKHAGRGWPAALKEVDVEEKDGTVQPYLYATSPAGLVAAAQMGTIEFHVWGARIDRLGRPDRLVFDLDPDEGLDFATTRAAAVEVRDLLRELGLDSVPILTGGKGIHVALPVRRTIEWEALKGFARSFAYGLAGAHPDRYLAKASKAERKGKIFVDWMRNERGATAIAPYSVRARKGAPVATPVTWDELSGIDAGDAFTIRTVADRLQRPCPAAVLAPQSVSGRTAKALERLFA